MDTMPTDFGAVEPDPSLVGISGLDAAAVEVEISKGKVTFLPGEAKAPPPPDPVPTEVEVVANEEDKQDQQDEGKKSLGSTTSKDFTDDVNKKEVPVVETAPMNEVQHEKDEVETVEQKSKEKETKEIPEETKEPVPPGWGKVPYLSPADQQAKASKVAEAKAKAKGKAKAKATQPKQQQVQEVKKSRGRPRSASAAPAVAEPPSKKGKHSKDAPKAKQKAAPKALSKGNKRKGSTKNPPKTAKVRKVDASEKEALRSKKCCAYQKVLRSLLREGIPEEEAREKAKEVARTHITSKSFCVCHMIF